MNTFRSKILIRILLILVFGYAAIYVLTQTYFWLLSIWLALFAVIVFFNLLKFLERSKRELSNFLVGIQQNDFSNSYSQKALNKQDIELHYAYTVISEEFQKLRREKESNYQFLQVIVEHSGIPMIGFLEESGEVTLMNEAAKDLFNKPHLKHIKALRKIDRQLEDAVQNLESGQKRLLKVLINNELLNLSVFSKEIKLDDKLYKLISFQNIKAELDEKELESWQKLIRVLTHEIKNSAIPISTLTEVVNEMIIGEDGNLKDLSALEQDDLEDLSLGLRTVEKRSKGLVSFVNAYGELARVPSPKIQNIKLPEFLSDIKRLLINEMEKNQVTLELDHPDSLSVQADPELIEQVLINLLKNAREALKDNKEAKITLKASEANGRVIIAVIDNGHGIDDETLENIFVPFYTTKTEGSGIGLSLSRQIMRAHRGTLTVHSEVDVGTEFYLSF